MKNNTRKILLALSSYDSIVAGRVPVATIRLLVPELSEGGFRSLLHALKTQQLITTSRVLSDTSVSITQQGALLLEAEFPALSKKWEQWDGSWECMLFRESPESDKQFRYLRKLLLSEGAFAVNRGVYLAPGSFSEVVLKECHVSYLANVLLFRIQSWKIGTQASFVIDKYGLVDLVETYSGISSEVSRLIEIVGREKRLIYKHKKDISLVYDRVMSVLLEDPGFCSFYFAEVPKPTSIVSNLHSLISL